MTMDGLTDASEASAEARSVASDEAPAEERSTAACVAGERNERMI
jgi:hypothetical protein